MYRTEGGRVPSDIFVEEQAVFVTNLFPKKRDSCYWLYRLN